MTRKQKPTLTQREKEVMQSVGAGMTSKEIANKLELSPRTIQAYLENIYWKLDVSGHNARHAAYAVVCKLNLLD